MESVYDDIDLQIEISPYSSEQLRRLDRGVGPDLVISPQPDSNLVKKYLLDISDTKASAAYDGTIMNALKLEGKTYLLPLPGVYSGYIVNETLFERAGLAMPANNTELVSALAGLKEKGLGLGEDDFNFAIKSDYNTSVGMFYVGYMVPDFLGTVEGMKWLADFTDKKAAFTGVWEKSFALSDAWWKRGSWIPQRFPSSVIPSSVTSVLSKVPLLRLLAIRHCIMSVRQTIGRRLRKVRQRPIPTGCFRF